MRVHPPAPLLMDFSHQKKTYRSNYIKRKPLMGGWKIRRDQETKVHEAENPSHREVWRGGGGRGGGIPTRTSYKLVHKPTEGWRGNIFLEQDVYLLTPHQNPSSNMSNATREKTPPPSPLHNATRRKIANQTFASKIAQNHHDCCTIRKNGYLRGRPKYHNHNHNRN